MLFNPKRTDNIGYLIQKIATLLARQNDNILQQNLGIGFSQFKLLMILRWQPGIKQKNLAEQLGQTEASISRQVKLMYESGLLQSTPNPSNKREHITTLTVRGQRVGDDSIELLKDSYEPMLSQLSSTQKMELLNSLTAIGDYLNIQSKEEKI